MTVTASPVPPRHTLSGESRETWSVAVDSVVVGAIELDHNQNWCWRLNGMVSAVPAAFGLRLNAIDELVHAAGLPSGYRFTREQRRIPERLVIAGAATGAGDE